MSTAEVFYCRYCGASFTAYTGSDRTTKEEKRAERDNHEYECESNPYNKTSD
jgi:ribosomal protein L31